MQVCRYHLYIRNLPRQRFLNKHSSLVFSINFYFNFVFKSYSLLEAQPFAYKCNSPFVFPKDIDEVFNKLQICKLVLKVICLLCI